MPRNPSKKSQTNSKALPDAARDDTETLPPDTRSIHGRAIPGGVYQMAMAPMLGKDADGLPDPSAYAQAVLADMAPRDAAEEMLIAQMLFAHARVMRLTSLANQQTDIDSIRVVHEYADRASNTYRRLMLALAEYRRPPKPGASITAINQANIAAQQVVNNGASENGKTTNEQGSRRATDQAALPSDTGGPGVAPVIGPAEQTMEALDRPKDAGGKVQEL